MVIDPSSMEIKSSVPMTQPNFILCVSFSGYSFESCNISFNKLVRVSLCSMSCSNKFIKYEEENLWFVPCWSKVVGNPGTCYLQLVSALSGGGVVVLWGWALSLCDLLLSPYRSCHNWVKCRTPSWCLKSEGDIIRKNIQGKLQVFLIQVHLQPQVSVVSRLRKVVPNPREETLRLLYLALVKKTMCLHSSLPWLETLPFHWRSYHVSWHLW